MQNPTTWTRLDDLRGHAQYRATNGHLVARTLVPPDGQHRCIVLDCSEEAPVDLHDQMHDSIEAAQRDAVEFMQGWRHLHG